MKIKGFNVVIVLFCSLLCLTSCGKQNKGQAGSKAGGANIMETGEIAAVNTRSFVLPRYGYWYEMRVVGILEHGTIVEPGDSIIQLDPSEINRFIIDRESNLETQIANLEKLRVERANGVQEHEAYIKNEIASFNLKKIEFESSRFESERIRKIKELEFEQAKIRLAKEEKKMGLIRTINENDMKIQEIRVRQLQNEIDNAYDILPALTLRTSIGGVFQIARNPRTGTLVNIGDNIYYGANLANVPELEWMKVNTYINENDFLKIKVGQKVTVRLDALSNVEFEGEISYIGKLCHAKDNKSRQKVFDVEVSMLQSDPRLKPGMTVSCEYLQN